MRLHHKIIMIGFFCGLGFFVHCRKNISEEQIVSRVGDAMLTREMLDSRMVWDGIRTDQEMEYVDRWVDRQLLYQEALKTGFRKTPELEWQLELLEQEYLINQFLESKYSERIQITDEEIASHYEQNKSDFEVTEPEVRVQHLLTSSREQANLALQELRAGKSFEEVAAQRSEGPFKQLNGEVGYIKQGDIIAPLERQAFSLSKGSISGIIKTDFGYHIIKVVDRRNKGEYRDLSDVKDAIRQRLRVKKEGDIYYDLLYHLRNQTKVIVANSPASSEVFKKEESMKPGEEAETTP